MRGKKRKTKLRLWVKIALFFMVLGALFLMGKLIYGIFSDPISFTSLTYAEDCQGRLDEDAEDLIVDFSYEILDAQTNIDKNQTPDAFDQDVIDRTVPDMTSMFANPDGDEAIKLQSSMRLFLTTRTLSPNDVSVDAGSFEIEINQIEEVSSGYKVYYFENDKVKFHFLDGKTSEAYHVPCEIALEKVDGQWKITSMYREDDWSTLFLGIYERFKTSDMTTEDGCETAFEEARSMLLDNLEAKEKEKEEFNTGEAAIAKVMADHPYDRDAAYEYASQYVKERNTAHFSTYDDYGGNCQNFASQMLLAGGIPMDVSGHARWKYYGDEVDESSSKVGRTNTWTTAPYFYKYAKTNTGFGLVAVVDGNMYLAEPGDILQVGAKKGEPTHTNVVMGTVKDSSGNVIDVLINSNTSNRINWPMSAGFPGGASLIQIIGYND